jgi:C4-dicarboxylate transporter DctM subunit
VVARAEFYAESRVTGVFWGLSIGGLTSWQLDFIRILQLPTKQTRVILPCFGNWFIVMLLLILILSVLGMFMETLSAIILTAVFLLITMKLGVDPIHPSVILVVTNEVACLRLLLRIHVFVVSKIANLSLKRLSIHVSPHITVITIYILSVTYFPFFSTWLSGVL